MRRVFLIARRELFAYFRSPLGAVILAGALLIDGVYFYWKGLSQKQVSAEVLREFFNGTSGVIMAASLFLAMRLFAEERQTGTLVLLNTAAIKDWEIVLGKFLSAFLVIALLTVLTAYMPALILISGKVSAGHVAVGYLGILLIGSAAISIGLFGSALARSQVVAIIVSAALLAVMLLLWAVARSVDPPLNRYIAGLALHHDNFRPFMQGRLELG
ncbi:MAG TPA: ABC transporter permease, partial [Polyangiaceae bacterium]|nr:ABC transporter permease [Polyangiaceae bacterium]